MDYQRENGRIIGLRTKRESIKIFALEMISHLARARQELREKFPGERHTLGALADWLNNQEPPILSKRGGRWQATQIERLFQTHIGLIEDIEKQFEREYGLREYVRNTPDYPNRERILSDLADIELKRENAIHEARQLRADLEGITYVGDAIPMPHFYRSDPNPAMTHQRRQIEGAERSLAELEERTVHEWSQAKAAWALVCADWKKSGPDPDELLIGFSPADPRYKQMAERQRKVHAMQLRIAMRRAATRQVGYWLHRRRGAI